MAQFDVYLNPNQKTNQQIPFLLDVQADMLDSLATRIVVPLFLPSAFGKPVQHLTPQFKIKSKKVIMSTAELAGVSVTILGDKIANLHESRNEIIAALDFLFTGI